MLYPEQTATRTVEDLSGMWKFKAETSKVDPQTPLTDTVWMSVPASFNDQTMDKQLRNHLGYFWYETTFNVPQDQLKKRNVLRFGAVSQSCEVYVNGEQVTTHVGGFTPFEVDVTYYLRAGANDLKVRVSNLLDNTTIPTADLKKNDDGSYKLHTRFDFYNYCGIHRRVKLYTTNKTHIEHIEVNYDTEGAKTTVHPVINVSGNYDHADVSIVDEDHQVVAKGSSLTGSLEISHTHRWKPLHAYLYELVINLYNQNDELLDTYTQEFGVRTIEVKDDHFLINGEPFYFKGFGRHEDSLAHGKGENMPLVNMDYQIMKWMGANSFRTSHYPYSEEAMRQADREGFVVIDECPAVGIYETFNVSLGGNGDFPKGNTWDHLDTMDNHKRALREMIERDHDHPSVVMWSVANEPASHEKGAHEYFKEIIDYTRKLDPQKRPITMVNIMMANVDKDLVGDLLDVICLNRYYGWYVNFDDLEGAKHDLETELVKWHEKFPEKPVVFTEFGADTVAGLHSLLHAPYSEEYQIDYYKANFAIFDKLDFVQGEQLWNFADFTTDSGMIRIGAENMKGVFTRDRRPKGIVGYLRDRWLNFKKD